MSAIKRFYSTRDIMEMLSCSRSYALELAHHFEYHGQAIKDGKLLRVSARAFDEWVEAHKTESLIVADFLRDSGCSA